jgi:hypothetical protein
MARQAGGISQRTGQVRFAQPHAAHKNHVGFLWEKGQAEEVLHLGAIDLLGPVPVKLVQSFDQGKASRRNPPSDATVLVPLALAFDKPSEVLPMTPLLASGLSGEGLMVFTNEGQAELSQLF